MSGISTSVGLISGIDIKAIGLFALVGLPYTLKFLWAPLVDKMPLPILTKMFGQRRAWREAVQKHGIDYSDGGDYAVLGHKFTIHIGA